MSGTVHRNESATDAGAEQELRRLREAIDNPIARIDGEGNLVVANAALESLLGVERAHILGYPAERFLTRESLVWIERAGAEPSMVEVAFIRDDGTTLSVGARVERLPTQEIELLVGASVDVSTALVELHGKAGIGSIAAEVVHEVNNHLLVLGGYAQLMPLHIRRAQWAKVEKDAGMVASEVERCRALTDGMLHFSPRIDGEAVSPLKSALRQAEAFLTRLNRFDSIVLRLDLPEDFPVALIAPMLLRQMLLNALGAAAAVLHRTSRGQGEILVRLLARQSQATLTIDAVGALPEAGEREDGAGGSLPPDFAPSLIGTNPALSHQVLMRICRATNTEIATGPAGATIGEDAEHLELRIPLANTP
ncbi:MAG: hypothetical protein CME06_03180 [Gemmatimonadetes bacterium]|nr:hypothetical protein [Gemmatimonadota bacterium]